MEIIRLNSIWKIYGKKNEAERVEALRDVNLTFHSGKVYAIMGPSGSGKSTLMHILGLLDKPSEGKYYLNGEDITKLSDTRMAHYRNSEIGFIFQAFNLLPRYSVYKNVELPMIYAQTTPRDKKRKIKDILGRVGLSHRIYHKPSQLSGGERQRVAIARALVNQPSILMADEPTGNLDSKKEQEILNLFRELKDDSRTIILVTHSDNVAKFSDEVIRIRDGEVV